MSQSATVLCAPEEQHYSQGCGVSAEAKSSRESDVSTQKPARKSKKRGKANLELGRRGEDAAARFLVRRGYDIVARNWKCFAGEVDIVARDDNWVVFVEVKTRASCEKGLPGEAVTPAKRQRYEKIAGAFLADYAVVDVPVRFDVIAISLVAPDRALIRHHIDAFGVD